MNRGRRRFLTIMAGCALATTGSRPATAEPVVWRGRALGAEARIELFSSDSKEAARALTAARDTIHRMERHFSLYQAGSALNRLNSDGTLQMPPEFARLIGHVDRINRQTEGLFDPTIQPLMVAQARRPNGLTRKERAALGELVGWDKVRRQSSRLHYSIPGMAMTMNGIAQGFATDRTSEVLRAHGFDPYLVHIGEYRAGEQSARIGVAGKSGNILDSIDLKNAAVATSAPSGTRFSNGSGHIMHPDLTETEPRWQSVSVQAETATWADGLSTALALASSRELAEKCVVSGAAQAIWLEDGDGSLLRV